MRRSTFVPDRRFGRMSAAQRSKWLAAFDRSGLSAAAFIRKHGLQYTTFCGWRQRRTKSKSSPGFVQNERLTGHSRPGYPAALMILVALQVEKRVVVVVTGDAAGACRA